MLPAQELEAQSKLNREAFQQPLVLLCRDLAHQLVGRYCFA